MAWKTPNIDRLASRGRAFHRHYVQSPTCGASRYTLLTGRYGSAGNGALFQRASRLREAPTKVPPSMPAWFRDHGYTTVSVGKVSHHPGGRGGKDWDDDDSPEMPNSWDRHLLPGGPWKHPRGWMHGLAHGEIRVNAGKMDVFQSAEGPDTIYPDGVSMASQPTPRRRPRHPNRSSWRWASFVRICRSAPPRNIWRLIETPNCHRRPTPRSPKARQPGTAPASS